MHKEIITSVPDIFIRPRKYFKEVITGKQFTTKEVATFFIALTLFLVTLHAFEYKLTSVHQGTAGVLIYFLSYIAGILLSFMFRTYFLTMILRKTGVEINFTTIGMIVGIAMIPVIAINLIFIVFQAIDYDIYYVKYAAKLWNLFLIFIGLQTAANIKTFRTLFIILIMVGFELIVSLVFDGMQL